MNPVLGSTPVTRRDEIVTAARELCMREGLDALRMRRVADAVGITAPAIYRHFAGKEELVEAVVAGANEVLGRYLRRGLDGADPMSRLKLLVSALLEFSLTERNDYEILFIVGGRLYPDRLPLAQRSPNFVFWLDRIRECIDTGALRADLDPVLTGISMWAQIQGLVALHLQGRFGNDEEQFRQVFRDSTALFLDGLSYGPTAA